MDFVLSQIGDRPNAIREWCLRRETAYWERFHWPQKVCALAAARDLLVWQLAQDADAVWEYLQSQTKTSKHQTP
jgi:hypothetical protein